MKRHGRSLGRRCFLFFFGNSCWERAFILVKLTVSENLGKFCLRERGDNVMIMGKGFLQRYVKGNAKHRQTDLLSTPTNLSWWESAAAMEDEASLKKGRQRLIGGISIFQTLISSKYHLDIILIS